VISVRFRLPDATNGWAPQNVQALDLMGIGHVPVGGLIAPGG